MVVVLVSFELIPALLGSCLTMAAAHKEGGDVEKLTEFSSSHLFHRVYLLLRQMPDRVRLVGRRRRREEEEEEEEE